MTQGLIIKPEGASWPPVTAGYYYRKEWSGADAGGVNPTPISPDSVHIVERLGFGAAAARDIFTEMADTARRERNQGNSSEERRDAYDKLIRERNNRSQRRFEERLNRLIRKEQSRKGRELYYAQLKAEAKRQGLKRKFQPVAEKDPFWEKSVWRPLPRVSVPSVKAKIRYPREFKPRGDGWGEHVYDASEFVFNDGYVQRWRGNPASAGPNELACAISNPSWISDTYLLDENDDLEMIGRLGGIIGGDHDFKSGPFLAELGNTGRMLGDTVDRLVKASFHMRQGDWTGAGRSLLENTTRAPLPPRDKDIWNRTKGDAATLSARLLEFRYGVQPLLEDAQAAARALAFSFGYGPKPRLKYRVSKSRYMEKTFTASPWTLNSGLGSASSRNALWHGKRITAIFDNPVDLQGGDYLGQTPMGFVEGLWEATPWSFVADWFVPIGQYLEALGAHELFPRGVYVISDLRRSRISPPSGDFVNLASPAWFRQYTCLARRVRADLSVPFPRVKRLNQISSFNHITSGIALAIQAFSGVKPRVW